MHKILAFLFFISLSSVILGQDAQIDSFSCDSKFDKKTQFYIFEIMPSYPGGQDAMNKFIGEHLDISIPHENFIDKVLVVFQINADGYTNHVCLFNMIDMTNINETPLGQEIARVFGLMPLWTPAGEKGKRVPVTMTTIVNL